MPLQICIVTSCYSDQVGPESHVPGAQGDRFAYAVLTQKAN